MLVDADATRANVIAGFREHLARAGPNDAALFAFAGHGGEEPPTPAFAAREARSNLQTLLLHDTGRRVGGTLHRGLADKEVAALIGEVAATGCHVLAILDCGYHGATTRDPFVTTRCWIAEPDLAGPEWRDLMLELAVGRPVGDFLPGTVESWNGPRPPHVASVASGVERASQGVQARRHHAWRVLGRPHQRARDTRSPGDVPITHRRGAFTHCAHRRGTTTRAAPTRHRQRRGPCVP